MRLLIVSSLLLFLVAATLAQWHRPGTEWWRGRRSRSPRPGPYKTTKSRAPSSTRFSPDPWMHKSTTFNPRPWPHSSTTFRMPSSTTINNRPWWQQRRSRKPHPRPRPHPHPHPRPHPHHKNHTRPTWPPHPHHKNHTWPPMKFEMMKMMMHRMMEMMMRRKMMEFERQHKHIGHCQKHVAMYDKMAEMKKDWAKCKGPGDIFKKIGEMKKKFGNWGQAKDGSSEFREMFKKLDEMKKKFGGWNKENGGGRGQWDTKKMEEMMKKMGEEMKKKMEEMKKKFGNWNIGGRSEWNNKIEEMKKKMEEMKKKFGNWNTGGRSEWNKNIEEMKKKMEEMKKKFGNWNTGERTEWDKKIEEMKKKMEEMKNKFGNWNTGGRSEWNKKMEDMKKKFGNWNTGGRSGWDKKTEEMKKKMEEMKKKFGNWNTGERREWDKKMERRGREEERGGHEKGRDKPLPHDKKDMWYRFFKHRPHCEKDGSYRPTQCHKESRQCWCVDDWGQEMKGTRKYKAEHDREPHCKKQHTKSVHVSFQLQHKLSNIKMHLEPLKRVLHGHLARILSVSKEYIRNLKLTPEEKDRLLVQFEAHHNGNMDLQKSMSMLKSKMMDRYSGRVDYRGTILEPRFESLKMEKKYGSEADGKHAEKSFWKKHNMTLIVPLVAGAILIVIVAVIMAVTCMCLRKRRVPNVERSHSANNLAFSNEVYGVTPEQKKVPLE